MKSEKPRRQGRASKVAPNGANDSQIGLGGHEAELKLEVEPADVEAVLASALLGDDTASREQVSVYFDTPDEALRKARFSLRVRRIGDRRIQTVKAESEAAAGLYVRPEWERDIAGDAPVIDDGDTPLQALIPAKELDRLRPAFQAKVIRTVTLVERTEASVELVVDRGEVLAGDRSDTICEVELELKRGSPAALFSLARELDHIAPVRLGVLTKSERGFRLGTSAAGKAESLALRPGMTTAAGFQAIDTAARTTTIAALLPGRSGS